MSFVYLFDLDAERNVPTLFSSCLFALNAALFWRAYRAGNETSAREPFWLVMCVTFVFLAIDEFVGLHEHINVPLAAVLPSSGGGLFRFAWVVPYGVVAALFTMLSLPVLRRIGGRLAAPFVLAGVVYVTGVLGMEMAGGRYLELTHQFARDKSPLYVLLSTAEETLEMAGLVLLVFALLSLLEEHISSSLRAPASTRPTSPSSRVPAFPG
jgi:hypothetical protein